MYVQKNKRYFMVKMVNFQSLFFYLHIPLKFCIISPESMDQPDLQNFGLVTDIYFGTNFKAENLRTWKYQFGTF